MRKSVVAAVAALSIAGAGAGALVARAQPMPPPAEGAGAPPPAGPWGHHHRWGPRGEHGWRHRPVAPGTFALFDVRADRHLTTADVQKIAEAFLLWNGNHTWKVIDVAPLPDNRIGFAFATPDNSVIARFAMNAKTGRVTRTG